MTLLVQPMKEKEKKEAALIDPVSTANERKRKERAKPIQMRRSPEFILGQISRTIN